MRILLAVSGGIDSMYLLHRAPELFPGASFAVAHCNFGLRGAESDGDEAFVRAECGKLGVDCYVERFDTLGYAGEHGISVEMAARELRYAWFSSLCQSPGFDALATAHNANDNAETLILNLLRGTGTKGLRGIPGGSVAQSVPPETSASLRPPHCATLAGPPRSCGHGRPQFPETHSDSTPPPGIKANTLVFSSLANNLWENLPEVERQGVDNQEVRKSAARVVRPLLGTTREEIRAWMEKKGFEWREDSTNALDEARRNKIRNRVFPVFAEINPSFVKTLGADIERFRQTDDIADDYYRQAAERIVKKAPQAAAGAILQISVAGLLELRHWRYVLWRALEDYGVSAETFDKLCTLLERYRTEPLGTVTLSGKVFESPAHILRARRKNLLLFNR
ncbi:MAG: tRNA lysidine(34) synthetase TilS [Bacteroidales bacterium]|nr:tRNA lysidine(34) synthetase TilS [Bacteroidales bacterium]